MSTTGLVRDNSMDRRWPTRTVIATSDIPNSFDTQPQARIVRLSCGDMLIQTFGKDGERGMEDGDRFRCRQCFVTAQREKAVDAASRN